MPNKWSIKFGRFPKESFAHGNLEYLHIDLFDELFFKIFAVYLKIFFVFTFSTQN